MEQVLYRLISHLCRTVEETQMSTTSGDKEKTPGKIHKPPSVALSIPKWSVMGKTKGSGPNNRFKDVDAKRKREYMRIYMHLYMYTHIYTCIRTYIHIYIHTYTRAHIEPYGA